MGRSREPGQTWSRDCGLAERVNASVLSRRLGLARHHGWRWLSGLMMPSRANVSRIALAVGSTPELVDLACRRARERRRARLEAMRAAEDALKR
jgi:hypothetical protein